MPVSFQYVVKETATNLRRNLLMTSAAVLTVTISLALVGGALLIKQGVSRATLQWRGGVELSIFMKADVAPSETRAIRRELDASPYVKRIKYLDHDAAYKEFSQMFENRPELIESVSPKDLPPSFRVVPRQADYVGLIGDRFEKRGGVLDVVYAKDTVETLLKVTRILQASIYAVAGLFLVCAGLLILNTIRMAIFARRREVAVMKLVGATNWFIRVPFMLEGMVQGMVGAGLAFGLVAIARNVADRLVNAVPLLQQMVVSSSDVVGTGLFILAVGSIVGAIGSAIAVSRFLDV